MMKINVCVNVYVVIWHLNLFVCVMLDVNVCVNVFVVMSNVVFVCVCIMLIVNVCVHVYVVMIHDNVCCYVKCWCLC